MAAALAHAASATGWRRLEVPLPGDVDLLAWLQTHGDGEAMAWLDRDDDVHVVGVGIAQSRVMPPQEFASPRQRWLGGRGFPGSGGDRQRWLLPRWELGRDADGAWLALHRDDHAPGLPVPRQPGVLPSMQRLEPTPHEGAWLDLVAHARAAMLAGSLRKVVLARQTTVAPSAPLAPVDLFVALARSEPGTFRFLLPLADGCAYVGASPERVLRVQPGRCETEALAGTRPRGPQQAVDDARRAELANAPKDALEHAIVADWLVAQLRLAGCAKPAVAPREVVGFRRVWHLRTRISSEFFGDPADLLAAVHPSPALCGEPRESALAFLSAHEPFERGWYCGAVGVWQAGGGEWAAGLRAAWCTPEALLLHAGAGIVTASDAAAEWRELDVKTSVVLSLWPHADGVEPA